MGSGRGMDNQSLGVADIGKVTSQLQVIDDFTGCLGITLDAKTEHTTKCLDPQQL